MKYGTIVMVSFVALAAAADHNDQGQYRPILPSNIDVNSSTPHQLRNGVSRIPTPAGSGPSFDEGDSPINRISRAVRNGQQFNRMPQPVGSAGSPFDRMPEPVGDGQQISRIPQPVGDGQQFDRMPQPVGNGNQFDRMPQPVGNGSPFGRMPSPIGNGNQLDRMLQPVGNGQQLNRMPQPIGDGNELNRMPEPVGDRQFPRARRSRHPTRDEHSDECGFLYVQASDDVFSGYVSVDRDDNGRYTIVADQAQAVITKIKAHNIIPSDGQGYEVMGATFGVAHDESTGDEYFRGNSGNFAMLTGASKTLYGKGPAQGRSSFNDATGAHQRIESAVFALGETGEILPSWVDRDGASIPSVWGVNDQLQIVYSANIGQYNAEFGGKPARVFCKSLVA